MDKYDPQEDRWQKLAPMTSKRRRHALAVVQGELYAVGGIGLRDYHDNDDIQTVEKYCPRRDKWTPLEKAVGTGHYGAVAVFGNAVGLNGHELASAKEE